MIARWRSRNFSRFARCGVRVKAGALSLHSGRRALTRGPAELANVLVVQNGK
jgi:hypothetical protein